MGLFAAFFAIIASPAHAEWREVRTDHFILRVDDTEESARDFGMRLERFDAALRLLYGVPDNPDQLARPIAIYALRSDLFYKTCGCPNTLGYYRTRPEGSFILAAHMPDIDRKAKTGGWSSQTLLLHEYSHHFTYFHFPIAYPTWFSEGFAEFNASTSFEPDGSVIIGYPANYRAGALKNGDLPIKQLLDPQRFGYDDPDLFYGRGWLLTHYLMLAPKRSGQLASYLSSMNHGKASIESAESAFGDLKKLDAELDVYQRGKLMAPLRIRPGKAPLKISVTLLPPGQAAMFPTYLLFKNGISKGYQRGPVLQARRIAARYPDDPIVQAQWAEAEFASDHLDNADAAADKAITLKPDLVDALVRKGMIAVKRAVDAKATDAVAWKAARSWFLKANRADPNAVMPLYLYYASFRAQKVTPPRDAVRGLMRVAVLAPESTDIRIALAGQKLGEGDGASARALLQPVAFAPHSTRKKNVLRQIIDLIDAGKIDEAKALWAKPNPNADSDISG